MFSQLDRIPSEEMGRPIHLWRFGDHGAPLLVFPSSAGLAHEWEYNGLVGVLEPLLEAGKLRLYCTESNVTEAWTDRSRHAAWRIRRHLAFERYVVNELVPFIRDDCGSSTMPLTAAGSSLGGYYSALFVLKFPEIFHYGLCLSGRYDARNLTDGFDNADVYFCNPAAFVPNLGGDALDKVRRRAHLDLVCGQGDFEGANIEATRTFSGMLERKGVSHVCDLWGDDVTHEWVWWNRQADHYLNRRIDRMNEACRVEGSA